MDVKKQRQRGSIADRLEFYSMPVPECGCQIWMGAVAGNGGYGHIHIMGRIFSAHRLAWELSHGPIPSGMYICHKCDTPLCIRVDHLFLGTPQDNTLDREAKNRGRYRRVLACPQP